VSTTAPSGDFGLVPVEIKHGQTVDPRKLGSLKDFIRQYRCRVPCYRLRKHVRAIFIRPETNNK
jgi:hypothetical protein